ncbi:ankyrin repeat domain-containing protein [Lacinutrix sp. 5H-3-7-4]|uniref:ankyrin repeat domain-containing protein n=1 Tax=Lacinutrix sp. (strain 5H-3-7-4) TaxID=983544 RepID=UPI00020A370C|nr:ankyrin repeat domain-containing protein [Lacinutrix sp. 5H-3-7-4]AEH00348.1 Ankyrin [Lacinutrix sp. 5H-3-7-4]
MKKTLIISAIALSFSVATLNADTLNFENSYDVEISKLADVSSFCKAIAKGDIETVKTLINLGEDINKKSVGMTPAMFAARYNKVEILELLIEKGANLNLKSKKGLTALDYAKLSSANESYNLIKKALKNA